MRRSINHGTSRINLINKNNLAEHSKQVKSAHPASAISIDEQSNKTVLDHIDDNKIHNVSKIKFHEILPNINNYNWDYKMFNYNLNCAKHYIYTDILPMFQLSMYFNTFTQSITNPLIVRKEQPFPYYQQGVPTFNKIIDNNPIAIDLVYLPQDEFIIELAFIKQGLPEYNLWLEIRNKDNGIPGEEVLSSTLIYNKDIISKDYLDPTYIQIQTGLLPAGDYVLVIYGLLNRPPGDNYLAICYSNGDEHKTFAWNTAIWQTVEDIEIVLNIFSNKYFLPISTEQKIYNIDSSYNIHDYIIFLHKSNYYLLINLEYNSIILPALCVLIQNEWYFQKFVTINGQTLNGVQLYGYYYQESTLIVIYAKDNVLYHLDLFSLRIVLEEEIEAGKKITFAYTNLELFKIIYYSEEGQTTIDIYNNDNKFKSFTIAQTIIDLDMQIINNTFYFVCVIEHFIERKLYFLSGKKDLELNEIKISPLITNNYQSPQLVRIGNELFVFILNEEYEKKYLYKIKLSSEPVLEGEMLIKELQDVNFLIYAQDNNLDYLINDKLIEKNKPHSGTGQIKFKYKSLFDLEFVRIDWEKTKNAD